MAWPATSHRTRTFQEQQSRAPLPQTNMDSLPAGASPQTPGGFWEAGKLFGIETCRMNSWRRRRSDPRGGAPTLATPHPLLPPIHPCPRPRGWDRRYLIPYDLKLFPAFHQAWKPLMCLARHSPFYRILAPGSSCYFIIFFNSQKTGKFTKKFFNCLQ